jgi:exodeoxyribonuclease VII small subunit
MAKKTFEMAMKQLEQIVHDLETGDLPLEKAIKKFEEGIQISKYCSEKLDESEKRITLLMRDSEGKNITEVPLEDEIESALKKSDD